AAVLGLPGQVPRAGIDDFWTGGIDGYRLHILDLSMVLRRDALPGSAPIAAAKDSIQPAGDQGSGIRARQCQGADGFAVQVGRDFPRSAPVLRTKEIAVAVRRLRVPAGDVHLPGIRGINDDVVQHHLRWTAQLSPSRPASAAVAGEKQSSGASAEKDA